MSVPVKKLANEPNEPNLEVLRQPCPSCKDLKPRDEFSAHRMSISMLSNIRGTAAAGCLSCRVLEDMSAHYWDSKGKSDDEVFLMPGPHPRFSRWASSCELCVPKGTRTKWDLPQSIWATHEPTLLDCAEHIKLRINICRAEHAACRISDQLHKPFVPTRLIHVGSSLSGQSPRLVETQGLVARANPPYAALSHCWGESQIIRTLNANAEECHKSIPWSALSKTFQHAITVTRGLGIDYIWIDSLCIVQDDLNDWAVEAGRMQSVYGNAYFTVAATDAAGGEDGLSLPRLRQHDLALPTPSDPAGTFTFFSRPFIQHSRFEQSGNAPSRPLPLMDRGWIFQERTLSSRMVHFTKEELVWDCFEGLHCECGHKHGWQLKRDFFETIYREQGYSRLQLWGRIVEAYTDLNLKFPMDILPGLSGLASAFHTEGDQYLAGGWKSHFPDNLLWVTHNPRSFTSKISADHAVANHPPSWSWASMDWTNIREAISCEAARRGDFALKNQKVVAELVDTACYPSTPDLFGLVSGGYLTVRSCLYQVSEITQISGGNHNSKCTITFKRNQPGAPEPHVNEAEVFHDIDRLGDTVVDCEVVKNLQDIYYLPLCVDGRRVEGLLLHKLDPALDADVIARAKLPSARTVYARVKSLSFGIDDHFHYESQDEVILV